MTTAGVLTEAQFREWLSDVFEYDWRTEINDYNYRVSEYMRGIKPTKHKEVKTMFHKDLTEKVEQLTKRVDKFESRMEKLNKAVYLDYYHLWSFFGSDFRKISASEAIEKILEYLKLKFQYISSKEEQHNLVPWSIPKKKPTKKAKKKK